MCVCAHNRVCLCACAGYDQREAYFPFDGGLLWPSRNFALCLLGKKRLNFQQNVFISKQQTEEFEKLYLIPNTSLITKIMSYISQDGNKFANDEVWTKILNFVIWVRLSFWSHIDRWSLINIFNCTCTVINKVCQKHFPLPKQKGREKNAKTNFIFSIKVHNISA